MSKNYSGMRDLSSIYALTKGISKREADKRLRDVLEILKSELLNDERDGIQLVDFLTLKKVERKEKLARNPQNPTQEVVVPQRLSIKCELGKQFYKELNHID